MLNRKYLDWLYERRAVLTDRLRTEQRCDTFAGSSDEEVWKERVRQLAERVDQINSDIDVYLAVHAAQTEAVR